MSNKNREGRGEYNIHHIIGQCHSKKFNVEAKINKKLVSVLKHKALNELFGDAQTPKEQLLKLLMEWHFEVIEKNTRDDLLEILYRPDKEFYHKDVL